MIYTYFGYRYFSIKVVCIYGRFDNENSLVRDLDLNVVSYSAAQHRARKVMDGWMQR